MYGASFAFGALLIFTAAMGFLLLKLYQANPSFLSRLMNYLLLGILAIGLSTVAVLIGLRTEQRGTSKYSDNLKEVRQIWGGSIVQAPPAISYRQLTRVERHHWKTGKPYSVKKIVHRDIKIWKTDIDGRIDRDIRKKGLQVYNGYRLNFNGTWKIKNLIGKQKEIFFHLPLPTGGNNIHNAVITINGKTYNGDQRVADGIDWSGTMAPGETRTIRVTYSCQGLNNFRYALDKETREIPKFSFNIDTDFPERVINYLDNSMVHSTVDTKNGRTKILWKGENIITRQPIALSFDSGKKTYEIVSNLYYYSPLAIVLFLAVMLVFSLAYNIRLHFMHFLFFGTGFLFFHFFLSYLVSYTGFIIGFIIASMISGGMILFYAKQLNRGRHLVDAVLIGLAMFQLFFSIAFYFPAHTGILILIGSAISLTVVMKATAEIDWEGRF